MFQGLTQGASLYVLYKNDLKMEKGSVVTVNTHLPLYSPNQPQALFNGMVTDLTVSVGGTSIPFAGLPANASVANFPDKGLYIAEDQSMIVSEVTSMRDNSQRIVDGYETHKTLVDKCDALLLSLNPDKQKEVQRDKELSDLKGQIDELKSMLSAVLDSKMKEN